MLNSLSLLIQLAFQLRLLAESEIGKKFFAFDELNETVRYQIAPFAYLISIRAIFKLFELW